MAWRKKEHQKGAPATAQPQVAPQQKPMDASSLDLTPEELEKYRKKFDLFDRNKDGIIAMREFQAVSKVMGFKMLPEELQEMFGRRDLDASGGITFDEFVVAMKERAKRAAERGVSTKHDFVQLRQRFLLFDRRKRGYIDADDAYPILHKELGFDEDKTEALVDMYDKNRDYRLTLPEFGNFHLRVEELKKECAEAFQEFDQNKDGFVDYEEACKIMEPKGFSPDKIKTLIEKADDDQDGKLNYQEFLKFWDVPILQ